MKRNSLLNVIGSVLLPIVISSDKPDDLRSQNESLRKQNTKLEISRNYFRDRKLIAVCKSRGTLYPIYEGFSRSSVKPLIYAMMHAENPEDCLETDEIDESTLRFLHRYEPNQD